MSLAWPDAREHCRSLGRSPASKMSRVDNLRVCPRRFRFFAVRDSLMVGHRYWGRWQDRATIARRTCFVRRSIRSSSWVIRWWGWPNGSAGSFLTGALARCANRALGPPGLPTRLVAGLFTLKQMHNLSDEVLCARWIENPYFQFFCGELSFCYEVPFDRSSLTRWRQRLGEEQLVALIQESLSVAHKTGAIATKDLERVVVDTTVQPKAIAHPTDARLMHDRQTRRFRQAQRCPLTSELSAPGQARRDHGRPLHPRPSIQARPASAHVPAHPSRAASSATSAARSTAIPSCRAAAARCSILPCVSASRTTATVAPRPMRCTLPT